MCKSQLTKAAGETGNFALLQNWFSNLVEKSPPTGWPCDCAKFVRKISTAPIHSDKNTS